MTRQALKAYRTQSLENVVTCASPHKLIAMLYDGAVAAIVKAKAHVQNNEIGPKGEAISKAVAIIDQGLKGALNAEAGGDLAERLRMLYEYMCERLIVANLKNDAAALDEVETLLNDLQSAWLEIGPTVSTGPLTPINPEVTRR